MYNANKRCTHYNFFFGFLYLKNQQATRNSRTPSPYGNTVQTINQQNNHTLPYQPSDTENEEVEVLDFFSFLASLITLYKK